MASLKNMTSLAAPESQGTFWPSARR